MYRLTVLELICSLLITTVCSAQLPELVKDINTYPAFLAPFNDNNNNVATVGNLTFFVLPLPSTGEELWVTDGTQVGTKLVKDINPGQDSSHPTSFLPYLSNLVVFAADDGIHGNELWISDGTSSGTQMVKDINPNGSSSPREFFKSINHNHIIFQADDGVHGSEIWISDLVPGGGNTNILYDIVNPGYSRPSQFTFVDAPSGSRVGFVYFTAVRDGNFDRELFRMSYGNGALTYGGPQSYDLYPFGGSSPSSMIAIQTGPTIKSKLAFVAYSHLFGNELWIANAITDSVAPVTDIYSGPSSSVFDQPLAQIGLNKILFEGYDAVNGSEPRIIDLTTNSVQTFDLASGSKDSSMRDSIVVNASTPYVLFSADSTTSGREVFKSDGATVTLLADIATGTLSSSPSQFINIDNQILFAADDNLSGEELWRTDGNSVALVKDIFPGAAQSNLNFLALRGTKLLMSAQDNLNGGLWLSDGSAANTTPLFDLSTGLGDSSFPGSFMSAGNNIFFSAYTPEFGNDVWVSDGTNSGTKLLTEFEVGSRSGAGFYPLGVLGIFSTLNSLSEFRGWLTDGTLSGTLPLADTNIQSGSALLNGLTYFSAGTVADGREIWRTDGTVAGTELFFDLNSGPNSSYPREFVEINSNALLFIASPPNSNDQLIATDGTPSGIFPLNTNMDNPSGLRKLGNNRVLFSADFPGVGNELGISDGTFTGTKLLADLNNGPDSSYPILMGEVNGLEIFNADNGGVRKLWRTDGTDTGTFEISPVATAGFALQMINDARGVVLGTHLIFQATDSAHGTEVWVTDGTQSGTSLLKDINSGTDSSIPFNFTLVDGLVYFTATDPTHGFELWRTDGTPTGTALVSDINPGVADSYPFNLFVHRGNLFFAASDNRHGDELWKLTFDQCPDDSTKKVAGACGCGVADIDTDLDGVFDCNEQCDSDAFKTAPGGCGCGIADTDSDSDGAFDCNEQCDIDAAKTAPGICGCGISDADLNQNAISDCLFTKEIQFRVTALKSALNKLKLATDKKLAKKMKALKKEISTKLSDLDKYSKASSAQINVKSGTNLAKLVKSAVSKIKKANKLQVKSFKSAKKAAGKALSALEKALVV